MKRPIQGARTNGVIHVFRNKSDQKNGEHKAAKRTRVIKNRAIKAQRKALAQASTYDQWSERARRLDQLLGHDVWRSSVDSIHFDGRFLKENLRRIRSARIGGRWTQLVDDVYQALHRHLGELTAPELYAHATAGTKYIVDEFFAEVQESIRAIARAPMPDITDSERLNRFEIASQNFGRSALLLSGGATLGFYHLGVARALWDHGLLPTVISGSSMGGIVAAAVCSRTDDELATFFARPREVDAKALGVLGLSDMIKKRALLDQEILRQAIFANCGEYTFAEAFERTGRVLNITVSPTRARQKPRVLNYRTSPHVLIGQACVASSAVPGLFPPVTLTQKDPSGQQSPYMPTETWMDGSIQHDLPKRRLSRLQNVNHFIVSQANPHVFPLRRVVEGSGVMSKAADLGGKFVRVQSAQVLELARHATPDYLGPLLENAQAFLGQDYGGDINIHPRFDPRMFTKLLSNLGPQDLEKFVLEGQRATWPNLAIIRNQTAVAHALGQAISDLRARLRERRVKNRK